MPDYDNQNKGVLFKNKDKTKDSQPHFKGSAETCCKHCGAFTEQWLSCWVNTDRNGERYMSLRMEAKEQQNSSPKPAAKKDEVDYDDDIPF